MKVLLQRVSHASVSIDGEIYARIGQGLVAFVGIARGDRDEDARFLAGKTANLRLFPDSEGKMNLSILDIKGEVLIVSQFTLLADSRKGRRPSFVQAALPDEAEVLFNRFVDMVKESKLNVATGCFQQNMLVEIHNQGPVTIFLDSKV